MNEAEKNKGEKKFNFNFWPLIAARNDEVYFSFPSLLLSEIVKLQSISSFAAYFFYSIGFHNSEFQLLVMDFLFPLSELWI